LVELASGREFRSIVRQSVSPKVVNFGDIVVEPGGRLLVANMTDGVRLFDLENGDELATVPQINGRIAIQADGALLTNGDRGLLRWPIQETKPGKWQLGPPTSLQSRSYIDLASDRTGSVIAQGTGSGALLVRPGKSSFFVGPHGGAAHVALSPDGKYVATGINDGEHGVKVWNCTSRGLVIHFPVGRFSSGMFSPDGNWLALSGFPEGGDLRLRVVKVGTWETAFEGSWNIAGFSPDGALLAAVRDPGVVCLLEASTGRELAQFDRLNPGGGFFAFSPDGSKLLITDAFDPAAHVWDLRAIRTQLAELGLDWDARPLPKTIKTQPSSIQVSVLPGKPL
jgi:WD40 repeat protein